MRRLVLLRHAKAEPFAATDRDRALTDRGRRDAVAAGAYLREQGWMPDHVVVSSAQRTRQTWQCLDEAMHSGVTPVYDDAVYSGSSDVVMDVLRSVPTESSSVLFVGHQPTVGYLAHLLDDGSGEHEALHSLLHGFPTASLAVFEVDVAWSDLGPETGRLVAFRAGDR